MRQLNDYVEAMFSTLPKTQEVVDIKLQILEHAQDKYEALLEQGMNKNEALGSVISEFGSIDEIREEFSIPAEIVPPPNAPDPELEQLLREFASFVPKLHIAVAVSVFLFILAPILTAMLDAVLLLFVMIALGVGLLIYFVGRKNDYRILINERRLLLGLGGETSFSGDDAYPGASRKRRQLYSLLPLAAVVIYLILGFSFNLWHPGWILFLCVPIVISLLEFLRKD